MPCPLMELCTYSFTVLLLSHPCIAPPMPWAEALEQALDAPGA